IQVIDTGIIPDALQSPGYQERHPWLAGIEGPPDVAQTNIVNRPYKPGDARMVIPVTPDGTDAVFTNDMLDQFGHIKEYAGHGTFIAGVIGCVAPAAKIRMHNALQSGGALLESDLGDTLLRVMDQYGWPDIISLSAGCPTWG